MKTTERPPLYATGYLERVTLKRVWKRVVQMMMIPAIIFLRDIINYNYFQFNLSLSPSIFHSLSFLTSPLTRPLSNPPLCPLNVFVAKFFVKSLSVRCFPWNVSFWDSIRSIFFSKKIILFTLSLHFICETFAKGNLQIFQKLNTFPVWFKNANFETN